MKLLEDYKTFQTFGQQQHPKYNGVQNKSTLHYHMTGNLAWNQIWTIINGCMRAPPHLVGVGKIKSAGKECN